MAPSAPLHPPSPDRWHHRRCRVHGWSFIDRKVEEQAFYSRTRWFDRTGTDHPEELAVETMERKIALVEVTGKTTAHTSLYEAAHANLKAKADAWNAARKKSSIS